MLQHARDQLQACFRASNLFLPDLLNIFKASRRALLIYLGFLIGVGRFRIIYLIDLP